MVYCSIIIFDFSRPDFIYRAVDFLKKEISGIDSEIILIKSYRNPDIEKFLDDNEIKYIDLMDENKQSDYIKTACKVASGEIMIFMDDDDMFYPGKIKYVSDIFKKNKNLGYYHNNFDTIDESENINVNRNYKTPKFETLYINNNAKSEFFKKARNLKLMLKIRPDFNSSSIAVRKSLLSEYNKDYDFNVRPDSFIFGLALISSMDIMLDNIVLTHYRIYSGNVSTSYNASLDKLRKTFMEAFSAGISMFGIIETMLRGSAFESYIELRIINLKLAYNFWSLTGKYKINFHGKILILKIDFIHEFGYMALSAMPASVKLKAIKMFYHAKE
jgi:hypothetical protein